MKGKISSRIRFALQDVVDLRENKWVPRQRQDSQLKSRPQPSRPDLERIRSIKKPGDKEKESSGLRAVSKWGSGSKGPVARVQPGDHVRGTAQVC